jgi:hypothetical protein
MRRTSLLGIVIAALAVDPGVGAPRSSAGPFADAAAGAESAPPADLDLILSEARKRQFADVAAWARYRFRRRVISEKLDQAGAVFERENAESVVSPLSGGFEDVLVKLNGGEPTRSEIDRHRRIGKFAKHYAALVAGQGGEGAEGAFSLSRLLRLSAYRYAGKEAFNGVPCHRLDFSPQPAAPGDGLAGRFTSAMEGSLWIALDGHHLAGARARTMRPISIALSLGKIHRLEVLLESQAAEPDIWLPRRVEVRSDARILVKGIHRRSVYEYSEFVRVPP